MTEIVTPYRPVGTAELKLIETADWKAFPPRLPDQPVFYPVTNEDYASMIARDWNVKYNDGPSASTMTRVPIHAIS